MADNITLSVIKQATEAEVLLNSGSACYQNCYWFETRRFNWFPSVVLWFHSNLQTNKVLFGCIVIHKARGVCMHCFFKYNSISIPFSKSQKQPWNNLIEDTKLRSSLCLSRAQGIPNPISSREVPNSNAPNLENTLRNCFEHAEPRFPTKSEKTFQEDESTELSDET